MILSTVGDTPPSSLKRCGLEQTITPSVSQSSGCFRGRSLRPIPSFPCSSSMSRSCELLLLRKIGPIFLRKWPSRNIGWTLGVSFVRLMTDLSCPEAESLSTAEGWRSGRSRETSDAPGNDEGFGNSFIQLSFPKPFCGID